MPLSFTTGVTLVVVLTLLGMTSSYPDGPPLYACTRMQPGTQVGILENEGHDAPPQNYFPTWGRTREPPYYITISPDVKEYTPLQNFEITITANQTNGINMYKGILMQAREVICSNKPNNSMMMYQDEPLGKFSVTSDRSRALLKTLDCHEQVGSAVSHYSPQFKINETVQWQAPDKRAGHIVFVATLVQEKHIYWTEVHSRILQDQYDEVPTCAASFSFASYVLLFVVSFVTVSRNTW